MPLKEAVIPHMHMLSDAAQCIGAVNTITVKQVFCQLSSVQIWMLAKEARSSGSVKTMLSGLFQPLFFA